jgi:hypothetical protein
MSCLEEKNDNTRQNDENLKPVHLIEVDKLNEAHY